MTKFEKREKVMALVITGLGVLATYLAFFKNESNNANSSPLLALKDSSKVEVSAPTFTQTNEVKGDQKNEFVGRDKVRNVTTINNAPQQQPTKSETNTNSGTNYGNIGGHNNQVTNNFGTKPRQVSDSLINAIMAEAPERTTSITLYHRSPDGESLIFKANIIDALKKRGYSHVYANGQISDGLIGGSGVEVADHWSRLRLFWEGNTLAVVVPPQ